MASMMTETTKRLERRTVQIGNRLYEIRLKPAIHKRRPVIAIQILRGLGATDMIFDKPLHNAIHNRIFASPNLSMYIDPRVLNLITRL